MSQPSTSKIFLPHGYTDARPIEHLTNVEEWLCTRPEPTNPETKQNVVIKRIRDIASKNRSCRASDALKFIKRVFREISVLKLFEKCEEFITILDMYLSPDELDLFIVMPFIEHSLQSALEDPNVRNIGLSEDLTRYIIMQLLVALSRMEQCKCIHRDLSLKNVLVEAGHYSVYLTDFGLSRAHYEPGYDMTNVDLVTLAYRPPEITLRGQRLSNKIDIWSLGIIMVECLNGAPFIHGSRDDVAHLLAMLEHADKPLDLGERTLSMMSATAGEYLKSNWDVIQAMKPNVAAAITKEVSPECIDVLRAMVRFHPDDRLSALELLSMPWFANAGEDVEVMSEMLANPDAPVVGLTAESENLPLEEMLERIRGWCALGVKPLVEFTYEFTYATTPQAD